jgi:Toprim-like
MPPSRNLPRFCDPDEFVQDPGKQNHFPTVYIRCLDCGGPAWFNLSDRYGQCYICDKVHKLHSHFKDWSDADIVARCDLTLPAYRTQTSREPETIRPVSLSSRALAYIASRGISQMTLLLFPVLQEVKHWGKTWLCWLNVAGSYELREVFGTERAMPRGSTKTYSRFDLRPGAHVVVGEGLFSVLSYAQLHDYIPDSYVVLNSTSCVPHLIRDLPTWSVEQVTLALDADAAGMQAKRELYGAFVSHRLHIKVDHPRTVGKDWNDILLEEIHARNSRNP